MQVFPALWKRIGADLVSFSLGWSIGFTSPNYGYAVELNIAVGVIGLVAAYWFQSRQVARGWQSVAIGFAGVVLGAVLLPPKIPDPADNYSAAVFMGVGLAWVCALIGGSALTLVPRSKAYPLA